ncbi:ion transporter [Pseudomonas sp. CAU 1711]|uniref:ion transporter n=1 Tax=Pseudomonas sp. CAU 1711 TaxID=3140356 RepID=UPI0032604121
MDKPESWRERLYLIIFHTDTPAGQRFDRWLLIAILASLAVVMLDSIDEYRRDYGLWLSGLEWAFTALFALEYGLRLYCSPKRLRYAFSFFGLIDLLAILPAFIGLFYGDAQYLLVVRALRLIRVFRVLKLSPYMKQANFLLTALRGSQQKITVFFVCIATLVMVFGALMYVIEGPHNGFTSIPKSIYWAIVTLTTVGFGDVVPKTPLGQTVASLVMITGYSVIAVPTGIFGAELANAMRGGERQRHACPSCAKPEHDPAAAFCDRCGNPLYPRQVAGDA